MGGEDLRDIPACLGRRPAAGESTLNPLPTQGDQEATALRSTHNQDLSVESAGTLVLQLDFVRTPELFGEMASTLLAATLPKPKR